MSGHGWRQDMNRTETNHTWQSKQTHMTTSWKSAARHGVGVGGAAGILGGNPDEKS